MIALVSGSPRACPASWHHRALEVAPSGSTMYHYAWFISFGAVGGRVTSSLMKVGQAASRSA